MAVTTQNNPFLSQLVGPKNNENICEDEFFNLTDFEAEMKRLADANQVLMDGIYADEV